MKSSKLLLAVVMSLAPLAWTQSTTPQTPPPGAQTGSSAGSQSSTAPRPPQRGMEGSSEDRMRMQQHMQAMQNDLAKMRSLLEQMKSSAAGLSGNEKTAMEANVQLWQMMIDHMSQMAEHMSSMQGGMGMSGHSGMKHKTGGAHNHGNMQGPASAAPSSPESNNPPTPPERR